MRDELPQDEAAFQPVGVTRPDGAPRQNSEAWGDQWLIGLAVAAFMFNVAGPPLMRLARLKQGVYDGWIVLIAPPVVGVILGEIGAMACWLVWGPGAFLKRLAMHWAIGVALGIGLVGGMVIFLVELFEDSDWKFVAFDMFAAPACILPIVSLGVQLPLWPYRIYFGWRVEYQPSGEKAPSSPPLSIFDILTGIAVVAVPLAMVRAMRVPDAEFVWIAMAGSAVFASIASFLLLVPAMFFVLRMRDPIVGIGLYFGYVLALAVLAMLTIPETALELQTVLGILCGSSAFMATLAAPLFVWRACGYRLVRVRDQKRA